MSLRGDILNREFIFDKIRAQGYDPAAVMDALPEILSLLNERDGGWHDADCRSFNFGRACNCGHAEVSKLLERIKEKP